jgi:hypothetical protein
MIAPEYIVIAGGAVNVAGTSFRVWETLRGRNQPNRVTWILWSLAPLIATAAALSDGAGWGALPVFVAGFCPLMVVVASFVNKKAYWKLTFFDFFCGAVSLLAMALWRITDNPDYATLFAIISDGLASVPTIRKTWTHPWSETGPAYVACLVNALCSYVAVSSYSFSQIGFATYLVALMVVLLVLIYARRPFVERPR